MEEKVMKDCKVLALCSQKGGVGKTTSCVNLAVGLAKAGKKVLVIDNDPQGSMTASLGYHNPDELPITLATILTKIVEDELFENTLGILHHQEGIDLIPANIELSGMEVSLVNIMSRELVLKQYIERMREEYDYILHSFENHPFQVNDDEAMAELVESVKEEGILTALLVRPLGDGEYEIIAGHRRRHAAQLAGLKEVPVIIRNMDQDTAVRAMVDSNLQRPNILPSEKAFAYRMKMEAMNHQGTSGGISAKDIGKNANDSARQVYRYIRLTYLMNDLLNAVDRDVIGLQVGVELSYLTVPEQEMVEEVHESTGKYPSLEQAKKIRQHREEKTLTKEIVRLLVIGERKKKTTVTLKQDEIKKYFPPEYDEQKIRTVICQLLEEWSNQNH